MVLVPNTDDAFAIVRMNERDPSSPEQRILRAAKHFGPTIAQERRFAARARGKEQRRRPSRDFAHHPRIEIVTRRRQALFARIIVRGDEHTDPPGEATIVVATWRKGKPVPVIRPIRCAHAQVRFGFGSR